MPGFKEGCKDTKAMKVLWHERAPWAFSTLGIVRSQVQNTLVQVTTSLQASVSQHEKQGPSLVSNLFTSFQWVLELHDGRNHVVLV